MITGSDGDWIWLSHEEEPGYEITGKYLFFSEDKNKLIEIAKNEIMNLHFHKAKVSEVTPDGLKDHVLCLYYKDDSRKYELAKRNELKYNVKFRYWMREEGTPGYANTPGNFK
ncbi:hypothetical protein [Methanoregula sp.]|uniref:hypothetical protein n=1 Tax=Methanoregula sp. TaxID=2052170 RepID=UPI003BAFCC35